MMLISRLRLKCDGTRPQTRFCLSAKRTSPFKSSGASVQSTTGSRGVRISVSNGSHVGYTTFQRWCEGYWLPTPFASIPFTSPPVRHRVPSHFNWTLTPCSRVLFWKLVVGPSLVRKFSTLYRTRRDQPRGLVVRVSDY